MSTQPKVRAQLSVRVEVVVEVGDEAELADLRESLGQRAADACNTFWGSPRVLHHGVIRRAVMDDQVRTSTHTMSDQRCQAHEPLAGWQCTRRQHTDPDHCYHVVGTGRGDDKHVEWKEAL